MDSSTRRKERWASTSISFCQIVVLSIHPLRQGLFMQTYICVCMHRRRSRWIDERIDVHPDDLSLFL